MSTTLLQGTAADARGMGRRRLRNLLVAILLPLALAAAYFAGHAGIKDRASSVPAMIVNEDEMVEQVGVDGTTTTVVAGRLVVSRLTDPSQPTGFDWTLANREQADAALASGEAYVVVTLPSDFSASVSSFAGGSPTQARVRLETDQSHDYLAAMGASALANAFVAQFGTTLTEQIMAGLVDGMDQTGQALQQAANGARGLEGGASTLRGGLGQLAVGTGALADGAEQLGDGASQLAAGQQEAADGASSAAAGARAFADGVGQYAEGASGIAAGTRDYASGVRAYTDGVAAYAGGVQALADPLASLGESYGPQLDALAAAQGPGVSGAEVDAAIGQTIEALKALRSGDGSSDPDGTMAAFCAGLADEQQQAACLAAIPAAAQLDSSEIDAAIAQLEASRAGLVAGAEQLGGLGQLGGALRGLVDGATQLRDGSNELVAGGTALANGGDELAAGAERYASGGAQLAPGGGQLASGVQALADGQGQLADGAAQLSDGAGALASGSGELADGARQSADGAGQLEDGAGQLADGLQQGADQASNAIDDPEAFAAAAANPVVAETTARHDPGMGGMLFAAGAPATIWLAALATTLRRRLIAPEELASTASSGGVLRRAMRRFAIPVGVVAAVLLILAHTVFGVPLAALPGTLAVIGLLALAASGLHAVAIALWGRRAAGLASMAALLLQLMATRGFVPLEVKSQFIAGLEGIAPLAQATNALQALSALGGPASWVPEMLVLGIVAIIAIASSWIVIGRRRHTSVSAIVGGSGGSGGGRGGGARPDAPMSPGSGSGSGFGAGSGPGNASRSDVESVAEVGSASASPSASPEGVGARTGGRRAPAHAGATPSQGRSPFDAPLG